MNYHIYSHSNGKFHSLGSTKYYEDAEAILKRWNEGYIVNNMGKMVLKKGDWNE